MSGSVPRGETHAFGRRKAYNSEAARRQRPPAPGRAAVPGRGARDVPRRRSRRRDLACRSDVAVVSSRRARALLGREPRRSARPGRHVPGGEGARVERNLPDRSRRREQPADCERDRKSHRPREHLQLLEDSAVRDCQLEHGRVRHFSRRPRRHELAPSGGDVFRIRRGDHLVQARAEPAIRRSRAEVLGLSDAHRRRLGHLRVRGDRRRFDAQGRDRERLRFDERQGRASERLHDVGRRHLSRQEQRLRLAVGNPALSLVWTRTRESSRSSSATRSIPGTRTRSTSRRR